MRTTEVMAHVVRIRKAHTAMFEALRDGLPSVRRLLSDSYVRLGELVEHSYELAERADRLRAHLDLSPSAAAIERELEDLDGRGRAAADAGAREKLAVRERLEREYGELAARLAEVGAALEAWHARILHMGAEAPDMAEDASRHVASELERMDHIVRAMQETMAA